MELAAFMRTGTRILSAALRTWRTVRCLLLEPYSTLHDGSVFIDQMRSVSLGDIELYQYNKESVLSIIDILDSTMISLFLRSFGVLRRSRVIFLLDRCYAPTTETATNSNSGGGESSLS